VQGSSNTSVTWSISEGSAGGAISNAGIYTAPSFTGTYHVIAQAQADLTKSSVAVVNVVGTGFVAVGSLASARLQHTATLLPNGKVLIVGGGQGPDLIDGFSVVDQAELFDPAAASFSPDGQSSHDAHTATLLETGDVLIAGGETGWNSADTGAAELENAANGLFVATGSMVIARESQQATLLKDGRVLITGGAIPDGIGWDAFAGTDVYDPATGTFTVGPNMNSARLWQTATLLQNGKVLITGGYTGGGAATNSAELFDPIAGTFQPTGNMIVARNRHTATLLPNGKVLIAGGGYSTAELYDPGTETFTATGTMNLSIWWHTATLLPDGTVLIAGGQNHADGASTATTEIYDPATGIFTLGPPMHQARYMHTATLLPGGHVLVTGGALSLSSDPILVTVLADAEIYQ
jgi:hypothetical protein